MNYKIITVTCLSIIICLQTIGVKAQNISVSNSFKQSDYIKLFGNLNNTFACIKRDKKITVAYLGGSITENPGWRDKVCSYFQETYPDTKFNFIHAGIGSLGSLPHSFRVSNDVLSKGKVDLMFFESAVNDQVNGTDSITQGRAIEGVIRHALASNPNMDILMMAFADPSKLNDYKTGKIPAEVAMHQHMASYYKLPLINLAKQVSDQTAKGEYGWDKDFKDVHPSPFGQEVYFQAIKAMLQQAESLYKNTSVKKKPLPRQLDKFAYTNGMYISVDQAGKLNGFHVNPSWHPEKGSTRRGFVDVPILEGTQAGASFEFQFTGNAVGICIASGYDAGTIKYTIDNGAEKTLSLRTAWSDGLHIPWYFVLGDALTNTKHLLKVTISNDTPAAASACRIVHFLVNSPSK